MKKFILGFITGGIICATATGFAVEYAVTANPFPVAVNGTETAIEGYNINDNTYFKLRDVAYAVGGFNVGFSDNTITVNTISVCPEPTDVPTISAAEPLPELAPHEVDGVNYIFISSIEEMLDDIGLGSYTFAGTDFYNRKDYTDVLTDVPIINGTYIPYDYYIKSVVPAINKLRQ